MTLVEIASLNGIILTSKGKEILNIYETQGQFQFNVELFKLMEFNQVAFKNLLNFCYERNRKKNGLLIFPVYSPLKLGMTRKEIKTTGDIIHYIENLTLKIQGDIDEYLKQDFSLKEYETPLIYSLRKVNLIERSIIQPFNPSKYNVIVKRIRDFWINIFLKKIYEWQYSFQIFDLLIYRGKQIGVIHATEFYPNFNGRIVYPTAVIGKSILSNDFKEIYKYPAGEKMYIHYPQWKEKVNQEGFINDLTSSYYSLRKKNMSNFVNLADIRELVCYASKIPEFIFDDFLKETYKLNLRGELKKLRISLESDRLPSETNAMYLKRIPVTIDGKLKNIIAIDYKK